MSDDDHMSNSNTDHMYNAIVHNLHIDHYVHAEIISKVTSLTNDVAVANNGLRQQTDQKQKIWHAK